MSELKDVFQKKSFSLHSLRLRLSEADALPQLTFLGLITGLLAGALLTGFRELFNFLSSLIMPAGEDNFEALSAWLRFFLPVAGSVLILMMVSLCRPKRRSVGVSHVIQRLSFHRGRLPVTNVILQFFTAIIALITGFSVGREGPAVHIGAGAGSFLGQRLRLPDNTLKTLAGCGVATAISVSFNTPLAGVVFAMEVIVRQYTLVSFLPIMTASVASSLITQAIYGRDVAFLLPMIEMSLMSEFSIAFIMAIVIGLSGAAFIKLQTLVMDIRKGRLVLPVLLAGLVMGAAGAAVPELMGMGYDTTTNILSGSLFSLSFLTLLIVGKLVMTALVTGLGIPGGIMGPTLFIGAAIGALCGIVGEALLGIPNVNSAFHALLGMVAMMAATLQAPLVALVTVLELTRNPNIIMPAMFVIVIACLISGRFFNQRGLFDIQLLKGGYSFDKSPLKDQLGSVGVASLMSSEFQLVSKPMTAETVLSDKALQVKWWLFEDPLHGIHIASSKSFSDLIEDEGSPELAVERLKLAAKSVSVINIQATLYEALEQMKRESLVALPVVTRSRIKGSRRVKYCGVITRQNIEAFYLDSLCQ